MTDTRRNAIATLVFGLLAAALLPQNNADAAQPYQSQSSANYMVPACQTWLQTMPSYRTDRFDQGICFGIVDGLSYVVGILPRDVRSCRPENVTIDQGIRVALAYIERRPQRMHENFKELVLEASHEAWPCH